MRAPGGVAGEESDMDSKGGVVIGGADESASSLGARAFRLRAPVGSRRIVRLERLDGIEPTIRFRPSEDLQVIQ